MSLEAYLVDAGYEVIGPFARKAEALRWLENQTPQLALLDVMLTDGSSVDLARELKARGVPFAIYSGLKPDAQTPEFQGVPWLEKPMSRLALKEVLARLVPLPVREQTAA
jgi:DNA-binding response OmpR family regulator